MSLSVSSGFETLRAWVEIGKFPQWHWFLLANYNIYELKTLLDKKVLLHQDMATIQTTNIAMVMGDSKLQFKLINHGINSLNLTPHSESEKF